MHLLATEVGILGTVPMVAATIPLAVGAAVAATMQGNGRVSVSFFGDGATEEGSFHESLNFASLKKLPVVFVCENNFFSAHLGLLERQPADNIYKSAEAHDMPGIQIDGNDAPQVYTVAQEAITRARRGEGPTLIECRTYRWRGHVGPAWDLDVGIRSQEELTAWMDRCPIKAAEASLRSIGALSETDQDRIYEEVGSEVEEAVTFARESPYPDKSELSQHVFKA